MCSVCKYLIHPKHLVCVTSVIISLWLPDPPSSPILVPFDLWEWTVGKASGQVVSAGRGQHSAPRLAAAPCFRLFQARGQPGTMGILERIGEIEKEIARTQKNKGEGAGIDHTWVPGWQVPAAPCPPARRCRGSRASGAWHRPSCGGKHVLIPVSFLPSRCSVSWSLRLAHTLQHYGAHTLVLQGCCRSVGWFRPLVGVWVSYTKKLFKCPWEFTM